ncbi:mucin-associated surface protein (MASP), putative, partial [Trypanosoma cruzi marinkellei]
FTGVFSLCLLRGVVCFCPFTDFNCLVVCVRCRCWAAAICDCAVAVRGLAAVSLLLLPLCVDGELVCAEGCTQVTGAMAMMMAGRVLLVCALCVLWCGAGCGGGCEEVPADFLSGGSGGLGRGDVDSQHSARPETPAAHTPGPKTTLPEVQEKVLSPPPEATVSGTEDAAEEEKAKKEVMLNSLQNKRKLMEQVKRSKSLKTR